jgi:HK97 family phage major capsid protein
MDPKKIAKDKMLAAQAAIDGIFAQADADNRPASADELAAVKAEEAKYDAAKAELAAAEQAEADAVAVRTRNEDRRRELAAPVQRRTQPAQPGSTVKVTNQREAFEADPMKGFADHREYLMAVMKAGERGGYTEDNRLRYLTVGSDEQSTISDPYGGFLVPIGMSPNVMKVSAEVDPISAYTTKIPMSSPIIPINARVDKNHTTSVSGGFTVGRRAETATFSASRQQYEQVTLNAQGLFGLAYATEELLSRSPVSFAALIEAGFQDEFPSKLIDERLNGTGVGQFEGIINAPCTVSVAIELGQSAGTILYENVIKMRSRCWGYGSAIWLANHDCLPQLILMNQAVGTGGVPVWQSSARDGEPDRLLGRPIFFTEYTQTVGTAGDLVLGNWSQYLEGTLTPIQSAESMHVRFENHERTFKFWTENDGRCWWRTALTPKRSTQTLSPFVTLAART